MRARLCAEKLPSHSGQQAKAARVVFEDDPGEGRF